MAAVCMYFARCFGSSTKSASRWTTSTSFAQSFSSE